MKQKLYKLSSILLVLTLILSTFICAVSNVTATEYTYYVSSSGDDSTANPESIDTPCLTIDGAIVAATKRNVTGTLNIKVDGTTAVAWKATGTQMSANNNFDIKISSNDVTAPATVGTGSNAIFHGDVAFENININTGYIASSGNNIAFGEGVTRSTTNAFLIMGDNDGGEFANNFTATVKSGITHVFAGSDRGDTTFNGNITYINDGASLNFRTAPSVSGTMYYNGLLNINMKSGSITYNNNNNGQYCAFGENGAMQVINSTANTVTAATLKLDAQYENKIWILDNNTGNADAIEFTEAAGVYTVNREAFPDHLVKATKSGGQSVLEENGQLDLSSLGNGEYTLTLEEIKREPIYYVSAENTGSVADGNSVSTAFKTVDDAIVALNKKYSAEDIVTLKVTGTTATPWKSSGTMMTANNFKLIITSNDTANPSTVGSSSDTIKYFDGDVELNNIKIGSTAEIGCKGHNLTIGEGVVLANANNYLLMGTNLTNTFNNKFEVIVKSGFAFIFTGNKQGAATYNEDVTLIYENASGALRFRTASQADNGVVTYNKAFNVNLKAASSVTIDRVNYIAFGENGALQVINSTAATNVTPTNLVGSSYTSKVWVLDNNTGNAEVVSFTDTVGLYTVNQDALGNNKLKATKNGNSVYAENGQLDLRALGSGEYTLSFEKQPQNVTYYVSAENTGSVADGKTVTTAFKNIEDAIVALNTEYTAQDTVTLKVAGATATPWKASGTQLTAYTYKLKITSNDIDNISTVGTGTAANIHGSLEIENININSAGFLATHGNNVTIGEGVTVTNATGYYMMGGNATATFGSDFNVSVKSGYTYIFTGNDSGTAAYNGNVSFVYDNKDGALRFRTASRDGSNVTYNKALNVNIKSAASVTFDRGSNAVFGTNGYMQIINDTANTITTANVGLNSQYNSKLWVINNQSNGKVTVSATATQGVYNVTVSDGYTAVVTNITTGAVTEINEGEITLTAGDYILKASISEYFEDFDNTTVEELGKDWSFTSEKSGVTEIVDGKLKLVSLAYVAEYKVPNKHNGISSKEQFISFDLNGNNFTNDNGISILARLGGNETMESYSFHISSGFITLKKIDGINKNTYGAYEGSIDGFDLGDGRNNGYLERIPSVSSNASNAITFNPEHTYRVALSVVSDKDAQNNEIALIRAIVTDKTVNEVIFDETFKDSNPYFGTEFALIAPGGGADVYIDNLYFSNEKFRDGDETYLKGDINRDGTYDIRDLVTANDNIATDNTEIINVSDKNIDNTVDDADITIIRKEILDNLSAEFSYASVTFGEANELRDNILSSTSEIVNKNNKNYYTSTVTVKENGEYITKTYEYEITGNIYYVSNSTQNGNGTKESPWSFNQLNTAIKNGTLKKSSTSMDAVLLERGKEYRLATGELVWDTLTDPTYQRYAYLDLPSNTLLGAYGEGSKPLLQASAKDYVNNTWTKLQGQNVWVTDAPELNIYQNGGAQDAKTTTDNGAMSIVFNGGEKIGLRKGFPNDITDLSKEKLYTVYSEGHFTFDPINNKLYIYSSANPSEQYSSIEVSRCIVGINFAKRRENFVVDNIALKGFGNGAITGAYDNNHLTVTNCEIGYSGGALIGVRKRYAGAVSFWCGGESFKVNNNWIYQTFDSAISPQGEEGSLTDYSGFEAIGNLLEYNNTDIEFFDNTAGSVWNNVKLTDNIMRYTTLGWGSRSVDHNRGIQGVIRADLNDASSVQIAWQNNTVDAPGMEIINFKNTIASGLFKFGISENSPIGNNVYYLNPNIRTGSAVLRNYKTTDDDSEVTTRLAETKPEYNASMSAFDTADNSEFYWLKEKVN